MIAQFKRAYKRNDKPITIAAAKFLAHLINQGVLHEVGGVLGVCGGHVFWGGGTWRVTLIVWHARLHGHLLQSCWRVC